MTHGRQPASSKDWGSARSIDRRYARSPGADFRSRLRAGLYLNRLAARGYGGVLILEPQSYEQVKRAGMAAPSRSSHRFGLFSAKPHLLLTENFWDGTGAVGTQRFHVIDAATDSIAQHAMSNEAYTEDELRHSSLPLDLARSIIDPP